MTVAGCSILALLSGARVGAVTLLSQGLGRCSSDPVGSGSGWFSFIASHPSPKTRRMGALSYRLIEGRPSARSCALETYPALFTLTTVIFANPSSNTGGFSFSAILRITSSLTERSRWPRCRDAI
jgi:hypothetical protein